jgi:hypothetical protein
MLVSEPDGYLAGVLDHIGCHWYGDNYVVCHRISTVPDAPLYRTIAIDETRLGWSLIVWSARSASLLVRTHCMLTDLEAKN